MNICILRSRLKIRNKKNQSIRPLRSMLRRSMSKTRERKKNLLSGERSSFHLLIKRSMIIFWQIGIGLCTKEKNNFTNNTKNILRLKKMQKKVLRTTQQESRIGTQKTRNHLPKRLNLTTIRV